MVIPDGRLLGLADCVGQVITKRLWSGQGRSWRGNCLSRPSPCHPLPAALDEKRRSAAGYRAGGLEFPLHAGVRGPASFPRSIQSDRHQSRVLVAGRRRSRRGPARLAESAGVRHRRSPSARRERGCGVVRGDRARAHDRRAAEGGAQARRQPGLGGDRSDCARQRVVAGARRKRHRRGPAPADVAGHGRAPPLSQRPRDPWASFRHPCDPDHQRERHGCDQRDPLWRQ